MKTCAPTNSKQPATPRACFLTELNTATMLSINKEQILDFRCITKHEDTNAINDVALRANEYTFTIAEIRKAMKIGDSWYITRTFGVQEFEYQISCH